MNRMPMYKTCIGQYTTQGSSVLPSIQNKTSYSAHHLFQLNDRNCLQSQLKFYFCLSNGTMKTTIRAHIITLGLAGIMIFTLTYRSAARNWQSDSLAQAQIIRNIQSLDSLVSLWPDFFENHHPPITHSHTAGSPDILFGTQLPETQQWLQFLKRLPDHQQQSLQKAFSFYLPLFELELKKSELNRELRFLPFARSVLNPLAVDSMYRAGLWQLTHFEARFNGLNITPLIDERFDATLASRAATSQLKKYRTLYNDDELSALALLAGPTALNNALEQTSSRDRLLSFLGEDIRRNIALFQAARLFFLNEPTDTLISHETTDTLWIREQLHFEQISRACQVRVSHLCLLNPQYRYRIIPADEDHPLALRLPAKAKERFQPADSLLHLPGDSLLFAIVAPRIEYPPAPPRQYAGEKVKNLQIEGKTKITYRIQPGDVLGFIAEDYDVRIADLKYWNNILNERKIQAGQTLIIFVDDAQADYYRNLQKINQKENLKKQQTNYEIQEGAKKIMHTVKSGESPYSIAKKYPGVSPEAILYWNGIDDARKIQIGQQLIIYQKL